MVEPLNEKGLPPAYGGCTCSCHRVPGIMHVVACCSPGLGGEGFTREWFEAKVALEGNSDVSVGTAALALDGELVERLRELIAEYFALGYAEGAAGRDTDTMAGDAQRVLSGIDAAILSLKRERDEAREEHRFALKLLDDEAKKREAAEAQVRVLEQERDEARAALERIAGIKYPMVDTLYALKATIDYARDQARAALSDGGRKDG